MDQLDPNNKSGGPAEEQINVAPMQFYPDGATTTGKEYSVHVEAEDDGPKKISSTTMNPAFLKEFAGHIENRIKEAQAS